MESFDVLNEYGGTGKIIKPFATNAGWLGRTFQEIKRLCPNSKVEDEMNIVFTEDYREILPKELFRRQREKDCRTLSR